MQTTLDYISVRGSHCLSLLWPTRGERERYIERGGGGRPLVKKGEPYAWWCFVFEWAWVVGLSVRSGGPVVTVRPWVKASYSSAWF